MAGLSNIDLQKLVSGLQLLRNDIEDARAEDMPGNPSWLWRVTHLSPAIYSGFVVAVVAIVGAFGLVLSGHDVGSATALLGAALSIVQAVWTHKKTTANAKVVVYKPDPVNDPTRVAAGSAVSSDAVAVVNAAAVDVHPMSPYVNPLLPLTYPGIPFPVKDVK